MRNVITALACLLSAGALANDSGEGRPLLSQRCETRTYLAHDTPGSRCNFWDEVMVGIAKLDPLTIRCARLEVTCPSAPLPEDQKSSPDDGK